MGKGWIWLKDYLCNKAIHLYTTIPPKFSVAYTVALLKGKSSAWIKKTNHQIPHGTFWARGYFVSTIGIQEAALRKYIASQWHHQVEQPKLPL